mmetsp:Transcript_90899/g.190053  ORF Transcript_90899/g.190053 Transcript_90899/m.190053 type:complete len:521 (+) Transcript_90899:54-1616(+)|eukprot:CAMPEP_0206577536 /NCGR_PEP_ID=MMETSP0325_2-20121206/31417_1 /ASSEMBLY_ACC=CAM_ASM_000347 /TAXON_ID=2866 /ORGANISM="Crypthecodinium cohnii, Strain Seligo" /LENGTH=520 /DNA_ID=CAMNT_0054082985 /DNA_START=41 /DNA_END=1603 /DNA_ORIENTATION=+
MTWTQKKPAQSQQRAKNRGVRTHSSKASYFNPTREDVLAAVKSLYADRLEPFGRILLRRVREQCIDQFRVSCVDQAPLVEPKYLHQVCFECPELSVEAVDGNEITVTLIGAPTDFVDVCDTNDPYPESLWNEVAKHCEALQGPAALLPGGRYACAQALSLQGLPCFQGLSLGEICHIVQLAVSKHKILGYSDGNMVPYHMSEDAAKDHSHVKQQQRPFAAAAATTRNVEEPRSWPVATWSEARSCLAILLRHGDGSNGNSDSNVVAVSNLKRLFRSQFGLDLNEIALGYSRLVDLLQDKRLQDVCFLDTSYAQKFFLRPVPQCPFGTVAMGNTAAPEIGDIVDYAAAMGPPLVQLPSKELGFSSFSGEVTGAHIPSLYGEQPEVLLPPLRPPPGLEPPPAPLWFGDHLHARHHAGASPQESLSTHLQRLFTMDLASQKATLAKLTGGHHGEHICGHHSPPVPGAVSSSASTIADSDNTWGNIDLDLAGKCGSDLAMQMLGPNGSRFGAHSRLMQLAAQAV